MSARRKPICDLLNMYQHGAANMSDGQTLLTIVIVIAILLIAGGWLVAAANEKGYIKPPTFRKRSSFRQYPTFPDGE